MPPHLPSAVPEIPVSDITAATTYYQHCLGFTLDWSNEPLGLAGMSRDDCRIFLANPQYREQRRTGGPAVTWLNMTSSDDVDALHRAWRSGNAKIISEPTSQPWGLHEFMASDLDGNLFRVFYDFATPAREAAAASSTRGA